MIRRPVELQHGGGHQPGGQLYLQHGRVAQQEQPHPRGPPELPEAVLADEHLAKLPQVRATAVGRVAFDTLQPANPELQRSPAADKEKAHGGGGQHHQAHTEHHQVKELVAGTVPSIIFYMLNTQSGIFILFMIISS